ncbi:unnamed protein product [Paramecium pentaurelia]|uniref:CDC20/Fizzy WD40 domain-containing protein n=1 Tax=Paramecium pentaurelia TaxID=43138 RepID=A0A8S1UIV6_9CILI|nr:unnamed protein product [Paramecium pentaurelia]
MSTNTVKMLQQRNIDIEVSCFEDKLQISPSKQNKENSHLSKSKTCDMSDLVRLLHKVDIQSTQQGDQIEQEQDSTPKKQMQQGKTCRYIPLRSGQKQSLNEEFQYREIEEENQEPQKGSDYKDQGNVTLKDIYKMHVFGQPLQSEQLQWESKNLLHFADNTPSKRKILSDINPAILETYQNLMDYREQYQNSQDYQFSQRKISKVPFKVLDAPQLQDDFYLNLIDWSSQNVLSVALSSCVYLWSAYNNRVTKFCDFGNNDMVCSLIWNPQGNQLAIGTGSGEVHIYDQEKMKRIQILEGHSARVGSLAWSGNTLCSGSKDRSIILHDPRQKRQTGKFEGHKQEVCGLKWSPDEYQLASGGNDNKLFVWRMGSQIPLAKFNQHQAAVKAIAWSPHRHGLLSSGGGTADRTIRFFNTLTTQQLDWIDTGSQVCNLMFSKNVNEFVSTHGYSMNQIVCWKYPALQKVTTLMGHTSRVLFLAMSPDGETIVTGAGDETLRFWNAFPRKEQAQPINTVLLPQMIR